MKDIVRNTIQPFPFMHILHTQRWWPSAWACRLWFPEPWRGKRGVQSPAINYQAGTFPANNQQTRSVLPAENSIIRQKDMFLERRKSARRKKQEEDLRLLVVALLVGAVCLPVCARSVGICNNYTEQFFMSCNISLLITNINTALAS